jgi:hypothetical protein
MAFTIALQLLIWAGVTGPFDSFVLLKRKEGARNRVVAAANPLLWYWVHSILQVKRNILSCIKPRTKAACAKEIFCWIGSVLAHLRHSHEELTGYCLRSCARNWVAMNCLHCNLCLSKTVYCLRYRRQWTSTSKPNIRPCNSFGPISKSKYKTSVSKFHDFNIGIYSYLSLWLLWYRIASISKFISISKYIEETSIEVQNFNISMIWLSSSISK